MWDALFQVIQKSAGPCLVLAFIAALLVIWALIQEWVIGGKRHRADLAEKDRQLDAVTDDRDFWRNRAGERLGLATIATDALGEATDV